MSVETEMKLKSYFCPSVEAAMELARRELGEEALLINARPATPETRYLGAYEVVFGVGAAAGAGPSSHDTEDPQPSEPPAIAAASPTPAPELDRLMRDLADLRGRMDRLAASVRPGLEPGVSKLPEGGPPAVESRQAAIDALYQRLTAEEVDPALARRVADGVALESAFSIAPSLGRAGASRGVVALVGPPGAGKTTTLVKLAARFGLACKRPAQILTADVYRIAAADQLRSLASILGIGCDVAETPVALAQSLEEHRGKQLVFIDTPGLAATEMEDGADLARLLATHPEIDTHLVLPASMKPGDMARVVDRYQVFQPSKLLFTRIDETSRYGALISAAARCGLPVSFLCGGQQIPDDLEEASYDRLLELVVGPAEPALGAARGAVA